MLYIPPGLGHHAVSEDLSLSLSFGIKSPRIQLILDVLYTKLMDNIHEDERLKLTLTNSTLDKNNIKDAPDVLLDLLGNRSLIDVIKEARCWEGY